MCKVYKNFAGFLTDIYLLHAWVKQIARSSRNFEETSRHLREATEAADEAKERAEAFAELAQERGITLEDAEEYLANRHTTNHPTIEQ